MEWRGDVDVNRFSYLHTSDMWPVRVTHPVPITALFVQFVTEPT